MGNVSGVNGSYMGTTVNSSTGFSPAALLEYCEAQMNGLNSQIDSMMSQQETQLNEQEAVQNVQTTLEQYGTNGPQNASDMANCVQAFQKAIASLPPGDPVAGQLQSQCQQMESTYGYTPAQALTSSQQEQLEAAQTTVAKGPIGNNYSQAYGSYEAAQDTVTQLTSLQNGSLSKAPANNQWQGTTDALGNLASDVKSNSSMQMLSLQDLVSQQQQAVEQTTSMMTQANQTLLDQAKAIGS